MAVLPSWVKDLFPGVSEQQLKESILSYGNAQLPITLEFIPLDAGYGVELESQRTSAPASVPESVILAAPAPESAVFLCTDVLKDGTPRYTTYYSIENYLKSLVNVDRENIQIRSLVKINPVKGKSINVEEIKEFFNEWGIFNKASLEAVKDETMEENFSKISSSVIRTAVAAGVGDGMWMGLCVAMTNHLQVQAFEISSSILFPFVVGAVATLVSHASELRGFELENKRKANPAERRAIRKRAIDLGWQVLAGMSFWTMGYYAAVYLLPIIFSALGWTVGGGPIGHLIIALSVGLCQAIGTTIVDYIQQKREFKEIDYFRLASTFATELVTGFAWYSISIMIPAVLAEPLGHLVQPAFTATCLVVASAITLVVNTIFNAIIPWAGNTLKSMNILSRMYEATASFISDLMSPGKSTLTLPPAASGPAPA